MPCDRPVKLAVSSLQSRPLSHTQFRSANGRLVCDREGCGSAYHPRPLAPSVNANQRPCPHIAHPTRREMLTSMQRVPGQYVVRGRVCVRGARARVCVQELSGQLLR